MGAVDEIVLMCPFGLLRDCFIRVLTAEFPDTPILAFSGLHELGSVGWHGNSPLLIVYEADRNVNLKKISKLIALKPHIKVTILSISEKISRIIEFMDVGIKAYVPNSLGLEIALKAIRLVVVGGNFFPAAAFLEIEAEPPSAPADLEPGANFRISRRELEVIAGVSCGKSNASIAKDLNISEATIKVHIRNIMKKMNVNNRTSVAYKSRDLLGIA